MTLNKALKLEMEQSVVRGVRFLDKHKPDWFTRIDLNTLNLEQTGLCVLGQCFGSFWDALSDSLRTPAGKGRDNEWAISHGFNAPGSNLGDGSPNGAYEYLTFAWVPYIAVRQVKRARGIIKTGQ